MEIVRLPSDGNVPVAEVAQYLPFENPYPNQLEAIWWAIEGLKEYNNILISAPTGTGKSAIGYAICNYVVKMHGGRAYITTHRKTLQQQYKNEFNLPIIYGRNNYYCLATDEICNKCIRQMVCTQGPCTVDNAPCSRQRGFICGEKEKCPYYKAKEESLKHDILVIGSKYLLLDARYRHSMGKRSLLVFDEAHKAENEILSMIEYTLRRKELALIFQSTLTEHGAMYKIDTYSEIPPLSKIEYWPEYLEDIRKSAQKKVKEIYSVIDKTFKKDKLNLLVERSDISTTISDWLDTLEGIIKKTAEIAHLIRQNPDNWVFYTDANRSFVKFKPVSVATYSQHVLGRISNKRVFMSATLNPIQLIEELGIDKEDAMFIQVDTSPFPIKNRPIHFVPCGSMSMKNYENNKEGVLSAIEKIIRNHPHDRILILPYSYKIQNEILSSIYVEPAEDPMTYMSEIMEWINEMGYPDSMRQHVLETFLNLRSNRLMTHGTDNTTRTIDIKIYETVPGAVMVSTYLNEGYDGFGDKLRVLIIPKVPYPDLGDEVIKRRFEASKDWYYHKTVSNIIQQCGRGVRHKDDYCTTYILDSDFAHLFIKTERYLPGWFKKSICFHKKPNGGA